MREVMLALHFVGLAVGLGTGFAHAFLGAAAAKMSNEDATKLRLQSLVLSNMGNIGIALLLVSGLYMITPYWQTLSSNPWLIVKLSLVALLIVVIALINIAGKKARNGDAENQFKKMQVYGKMTMVIALAIVGIAVKVFR